MAQTGTKNQKQADARIYGKEEATMRERARNRGGLKKDFLTGRVFWWLGHSYWG